MRNSVFSLVESSMHPDFSALYRSLGLVETRFTSLRKIIGKLKEQPAYIVAEFFYGYGNNYAGVNLGNLDTMLHSLPKYSPATRVIVFTSKEELPYAEKLAQLFPLHAVLTLPVTEQAMRDVLSS